MTSKKENIKKLERLETTMLENGNVDMFYRFLEQAEEMGYTQGSTVYTGYVRRCCDLYC